MREDTQSIAVNKRVTPSGVPLFGPLSLSWFSTFPPSAQGNHIGTPGDPRLATIGTSRCGLQTIEGLRCGKSVASDKNLRESSLSPAAHGEGLEKWFPSSGMPTLLRALTSPVMASRSSRVLGTAAGRCPH